MTKCLTDHSKLHEYAGRLAEAVSASKVQMMADCAARHEKDESLVTAKRDELRNVKGQKEMLSDKIQGQDRLAMQMRANLQYRELVAKERKLHAENQKLSKELATVDESATQAHRELKRCMQAVDDAEKERARMCGSKDTVATSVRDKTTQLGEKQYKRIDAEHREKLIEHKTVQMAVEDLNKYYKALNAALMRFHETKMADINKSVTELWNKTYKGSDIDGIAIKTEDEGQTADGRRKQTYRVVMRKGDTTLDMRGRCSAGQKVLASLIIRLALAQTFSANCSIIALDEPTTILDR